MGIRRSPRPGRAGTALVRAAVVAALLLSAACGQNYEAGWQPPPMKPRQRPRTMPANHPSMQSDTGTPGELSGTIRVAPGLADRIPANAYLYVMARKDPDGGIPLAIKRIRVPSFPYRYSLTQANVMGMGDDPIQLADQKALYIVAIIDQDGLAGTAPGDLEGACSDNPVSGSGEGLDILIDKVH